MGVFDDKKFEELDWISQTTEPIDSVLNEALSMIPESINIDFPLYREIISDSYGLSLSITNIVRYVTKIYVTRKSGLEITRNQLYTLDECFKLEVEGDELFLDFENRVISGGTIKLVKISSTMDEKLLESLLGKDGIDGLHYISISRDGQMSRANEIMDLLGNCADGVRSRSFHKKRRTLINRVHKLFKDNEWNIKDTELANKVGFWIKDYIVDGNLAAFSNFCRLKVMTHKGQPIYSMEEIV